MIDKSCASPLPSPKKVQSCSLPAGEMPLALTSPRRLSPSAAPSAPDPGVSRIEAARASAPHSHVACPRVARAPASSTGRPAASTLCPAKKGAPRSVNPWPAQETRAQGTQHRHLPNLPPPTQLLILTSGLLCNVRREYKTVLLSQHVQKIKRKKNKALHCKDGILFHSGFPSLHQLTNFFCFQSARFCINTLLGALR